MTDFKLYNKFFDTDMPIIYDGNYMFFIFIVNRNYKEHLSAEITLLNDNDTLEFATFGKYDTDMPLLFKVRKVYDNTHLKLLKEDL
jgi:hypothetical protein